jgi:RNA polymerase sigma-70 factor (ECF subfamily)
VRAACRGDPGSKEWVIEHFTPALLLQARYRLQDHLRRHFDPEDLVNDVWLVALPRLPGLAARDGRWTPVLVKFLSAILINRLRTIVRNHLRRAKLQGGDPANTASTRKSDLFREVPEEISSIVSRISRREVHSRLHATIESLSPRDRELLVLRGIEQISNQQVADLLGESPNAICVAYHRALERLRAALPDSVFAEFSGNPEVDL